jgi:hypothetical protein
MFIPHYRKWFQEQQLPCDKYDDKILFLFAIKIHGNFLTNIFLFLMLSIASLHLLFQISTRTEPDYLAISQVLGIWVEFGKTFFNVISQ